MAAKKKTAASGDHTRLNEEGVPFPSAEAAGIYMKDQELDQDVWCVWQQSPSEFVLMKMAAVIALQNERHANELKAATEAAEEEDETDDIDDPNSLWRECYLVTFVIKNNDNDRDHVPLAVKGRQISVPRGIAYPLPIPFIEAAKHAEEEEILSLSGSEYDRSIKKTGQMRGRFAHTVGEKVDFDDYQKMMREGTIEANRMAAVRTNDAR